MVCPAPKMFLGHTTIRGGDLRGFIIPPRNEVVVFYTAFECEVDQRKCNSLLDYGISVLIDHYTVL